jgi:hypothetical protein
LLGAIRNLAIDAEPEETASVVTPSPSIVLRFEPMPNFLTDELDTELDNVRPTAFFKLNLSELVDTPLEGFDVDELPEESFLCHLFPKTALTATAELQRPNPLRFLDRD